MVLDAKRAPLHADALTETYVKPPHLRDTERCWLLKKCMYGTFLAAAGWQHLVQKVGTDSGLLSSSICPCAFGHSTQDVGMVVHGDDFIVAGDGDDLDWLSQKLNEKLELVQKARLGPGYDSDATVLNRCVTYSDPGLTWEAEPRHSELAVAWTTGSETTDEPRRRKAKWTTGPRGIGTRKPITACQQDWHIWHRTDLIVHSLARSAVVQSGKQHVLTSLV